MRDVFTFQSYFIFKHILFLNSLLEYKLYVKWLHMRLTLLCNIEK